LAYFCLNEGIQCIPMENNVNLEHDTSVELDAMVALLVKKAATAKESLFNEEYLLEQLLQSFQLNKTHKYFIDTQPLNEFRDLDAHLKLMNTELDNEKLYIGFVQTLSDWRKSKTILRIPIIGMSFRIFTFFTKRVIPRLNIYKKVGLQRKFHFLSKAESIGRLIYNGFEVQAFLEIKNKHVFVVKKIGQPKSVKPSFGPIFKMNRIAKNGKIIGVYKLRTMHPYSEFVYDYMVVNHGFGPDGKIKDDFRTSRWGKILRKYWIDELPQLVNLFNMQMKLVGVRPVSESYFNRLPKKLKENRVKYKPGCIPPYVALDLGTTKDAVIMAEEIYLEEKERNPYTTDLKYLFKSIYKIIFQRKRSA
jgi:lipopolysaccharide/colanic/teichoic acid biosynthesis glycosyltransferase